MSEITLNTWPSAVAPHIGEISGFAQCQDTFKEALDLEGENGPTHNAIKDEACFVHKDACEYVLHIDLTSSHKEWSAYERRLLNMGVSERVVEAITHARNAGCAYICFYVG